MSVVERTIADRVLVKGQRPMATEQEEKASKTWDDVVALDSNSTNETGSAKERKEKKAKDKS